MYQRLLRPTKGGGDGIFTIESQGMGNPFEDFIHYEKQSY